MIFSLVNQRKKHIIHNESAVIRVNPWADNNYFVIIYANMEKPFVLQVAVCEDNNDNAERLVKIIETSGLPAVISSFKSGEEFLAEFSPGRFNLIFMDIFMNELSGIDTASKVRENDSQVVIAFTTSSPDFTRESYKLNALKYIDKPVDPNEVREAMELAVIKVKSRPFIALSEAGGRQTSVFIDEIMYLELDDHVINVHLPNRTIKTSQSMRMNDMEKQLPSPPFLRCHHSFLINLDYVIKVCKEAPAFLMKNGNPAYIRKRDISKCSEYEKKVLDRHLKKLGGGIY